MSSILNSLIAKKKEREDLIKKIEELLKPIKKADVSLTNDQLLNEISERLGQVSFFTKGTVTLRKKRFFESRYIGDELFYETFGESYAMISFNNTTEILILVGVLRDDPWG